MKYERKMNHNMQRTAIRIGLLLLIILLALPSSFVWASDDERLVPRFYDEVGLLTESEASQLENLLDEISLRQSFDVNVVVIAEMDVDGWDPARYAAEYYEAMHFGLGDGQDGAILLLIDSSREFGFATLGYGIDVFTYDGQEYLDTFFLPYLREDRYYDAFVAFAEATDDFVRQADSGAPYDRDNIPKSAEEVSRNRGIAALASLALALVVAFGVTSVWRGELKSVRPVDTAGEYVLRDSMRLTRNVDAFMYSYINKSKRVESSSSSSSSGTTSSGSSYSGHSGKY